MQRKATRQSRAKNAIEKKWQGWLKLQPCSFCAKVGPSIVDHCKGGTFKYNKLQIGEKFCNSKCGDCDAIVTIGNRQDLFDKYEMTDSGATLQQLKQYELETGVVFDDDVLNAISAAYESHDDTTDYWMRIL